MNESCLKQLRAINKLAEIDFLSQPGSAIHEKTLEKYSKLIATCEGALIDALALEIARYIEKLTQSSEDTDDGEDDVDQVLLNFYMPTMLLIQMQELERVFELHKGQAQQYLQRLASVGAGHTHRDFFLDEVRRHLGEGDEWEELATMLQV